MLFIMGAKMTLHKDKYNYMKAFRKDGVVVKSWARAGELKGLIPAQPQASWVILGMELNLCMFRFFPFVNGR